MQHIHMHYICRLMEALAIVVGRKLLNYSFKNVSIHWVCLMQKLSCNYWPFSKQHCNVGQVHVHSNNAMVW